MTAVPRAAAALAAVGVLPLAWGALGVRFPDLADWGRAALGPRFDGGYLLAFCGALLLAFLSGAFWGFASRSPGRGAAAFYALSVIPALWAFVAAGGGAEAVAARLLVGHAGALGLDWLFCRAGLAPGWWLRLRLPQGAAVVACLAIGAAG